MLALTSYAYIFLCFAVLAANVFAGQTVEKAKIYIDAKLNESRIMAEYSKIQERENGVKPVVESLSNLANAEELDIEKARQLREKGLSIVEDNISKIDFSEEKSKINKLNNWLASLEPEEKKQSKEIKKPSRKLTGIYKLPPGGEIVWKTVEGETLYYYPGEYVQRDRLNDKPRTYCGCYLDADDQTKCYKIDWQARSYSGRGKDPGPRPVGLMNPNDRGTIMVQVTIRK
jgi:hypothetical protein